MINSPALEALIEQIRTVLIFLQRPIVYQQIVTIFIILVVAGVLGVIVQRFLRRQSVRNMLPERGWVWLNAGINLIIPILILTLSEIVIRLLQERNMATGLIRGASQFGWLLLVYQLLRSITFIFTGETTYRFYHRYLFLPIFFLILLGSLSNNFIDTALLGEIELFQLFDAPTTFGVLLVALIILYFAIIISQLVQDLLGRWLNSQANFEPAISESILNATRYLVIGVGIVLAAGQIGFSFASLAIIGGGLSVGIGLGLQKIAANFVSGILLWTDRTIRIGDTIEVGMDRGVVEKMSIRSTIVKTLDNVELIIPNENLMTSVVRTYTKTERTVRVNVDVGVGYGSDPQQVRDILLEVVKRHNLVRKNPAPNVVFINFGDSSLDFRVNVWVEDPKYLPSVPSDLRYMFFDALQKHGIEIPFPQRDLNLGSGWETVLPQGEKE